MQDQRIEKIAALAVNITKVLVIFFSRLHCFQIVFKESESTTE